MLEESIEVQIENALDKIRPFLIRDGGNVSFVRFEDGIVYIKFSGACVNCLAQGDTVEDGIKVILMSEVNGVVDVRVDSSIDVKSKTS